jgi:hypothetical protein
MRLIGFRERCLLSFYFSGEPSFRADLLGPATKDEIISRQRVQNETCTFPVALLGSPIHLPKSSESVAARKYSLRFTSPSLSFSASVTRKTQSVGALRLSADSTWQFWRGTTPAGLLRSCPNEHRSSTIWKVKL